MADQPAQERTEQPTPKRLAKARDDGQVPRSQELLAVTVLLAGGLALLAGGEGLGGAVAGSMQQLPQWLAEEPLSGPDAASLLRGLTLIVLGALAPILLAVLLPVLLVGGGQARGVLTVKPLAPKWSRLSPLQGVKRIVGPEGLFTFAKVIAKLLLLGAVTWLVLKVTWPSIEALTGASAARTIAVFRGAGIHLALGTGLAFLVVALADMLFTNWRHHQKLRMTRQELVQEHRETEGDPLLKSRVRSLALQLSRRRMLQKVTEADVVIVNPTHIAVALRYDPAAGGAPVVVAMGRRKLAERIRALAESARVPIVRNVAVARILMATAKVGQPIPPALYAAIAEILAFVYRTHGRMPVALAQGRST